jgi:hypothetical protein
MSICSISSPVAPAPVIQNVPSAALNGTSDRDGDRDGEGHGHRHARGAHGGGQMQRALMQALQGMGLAVPRAPTGAAVTAVAPVAAGGSTDSSASTAAGGNVMDDLRHFMHALFQAVRAENTLSPSPSTGRTGDGKSDFAAGLSALITLVSSGSAPATLQDAFNKLVTDLQSGAPAAPTAQPAPAALQAPTVQPAPATPAAPAASSSVGATGTGSAPAPLSLQALLTLLQQDLGYGAAASPSTTGNLISIHA